MPVPVGGAEAQGREGEKGIRRKGPTGSKHRKQKGQGKMAGEARGGWCQDSTEILS